jgi:hypothetical protein
MGGNTMDLIERTKTEELAKRFALNDGEEWNVNIGRIVKIGAQVESVQTTTVETLYVYRIKLLFEIAYSDPLDIKQAGKLEKCLLP